MMKIKVLAILAIALAACQGETGPAGAQGAQGAAGTDGSAPIISNATAAQCPAGGIVVTMGTVVQSVCNGTNGQNGSDGHTPVITVLDTTHTTLCAAGGKDVFVDGTYLTTVCNGTQGPAVALWSAHTDLYPDNSTTGSYVTWNADGSATLTKIDPATAANIAITSDVAQHLTSLSFDLESGTCGGGSPRFFVTFEGDPTYYVYSCEYAHVSGATHSFVAADAFNGSPQNPPTNGVITAIEIVNDVVGTSTISNIKVNGSVVSTPPCVGRSCTTLTLTPFVDACDKTTWACTASATGGSATADATGLHLSKDADTASAAYGVGADIVGVAGAPFTSATFDTTGLVSLGSPRFVLEYGDNICTLDNPTKVGNTYTFTAASTYSPCVTDANLTGLEIVADGGGFAQTITLTNITVNGSRVIAP